MKATILLTIAALIVAEVVWSLTIFFRFNSNPVGKRCRFLHDTGKTKKGKVIDEAGVLPDMLVVQADDGMVHFVLREEIKPVIW